jgi:hypothetical protein
MNVDIYENEHAISKTGLDYIEVSPLDYWWRFLNPERKPFVKDKDAIFDEALRMAVTRPIEFAKIYVSQPAINKRTNFGKAEFAALTSEVEKRGQVMLSSEDYGKIIDIRDGVLNHPTTKILFDYSNSRPGMPSRFEETNSTAIVKFCAHWIHKEQLIVNLMTTKDASAVNFAKEAANLKLHKRAALQMDGEGIDAFAFVMVEKEAPYKIQVHVLDERSVNFGRATYLQNCATYAACLKEDKWPGLPEQILPVSLPDWAFKNY